MTSHCLRRFAFLLSITSVSLRWHLSSFRNSFFSVLSITLKRRRNNQLLNGLSWKKELTLLVYFSEFYFSWTIPPSRWRGIDWLSYHPISVCAQTSMALISRREEEKMKHDFFEKKNYTQNTLFSTLRKKRAKPRRRKISSTSQLLIKTVNYTSNGSVVSGTTTRLGEEKKKKRRSRRNVQWKSLSLCSLLLIAVEKMIKILFFHADQESSRVRRLSWRSHKDALDFIGLSLDTQKIKSYCVVASLFIELFFVDDHPQMDWKVTPRGVSLRQVMEIDTTTGSACDVLIGRCREQCTTWSSLKEAAQMPAMWHCTSWCCNCV